MIGTILKNARIKAGLTQSQVCSEICDRSMLSHIENNKVVPSLKLLSEVCKRVHIDVNDVLQHVDERDPRIQPLLDHLHDLLVLQDYRAVIRQCEKSLNLKYLSSNPKATLNIWFLMGQAHHRIGQFEISYKCFQRSLFLARSFSNTSMQVSCLNGIASSLKELGRIEEALVEYENCLDLINYTEDKSLHIRVLYNAALIYWKNGENYKAKNLANEGSFMCKKTGIYEAGGHLESLLGLIHWGEGFHLVAEECFQRALLFYQFVGDSYGIQGVQENLRELRDRKSI